MENIYIESARVGLFVGFMFGTGFWIAFRIIQMITDPLIVFYTERIAYKKVTSKDL